jgi:hypothetical protein
VDVYTVTTPDGRRWWVQARPERIEVYAMFGERTLASAPSHRFRRIDQLASWLAEHGLGLDDLAPRR